MPRAVGGTKFRDTSGGKKMLGVADLPSHVLAQWAKEGTPKVLLAPLPKYPPGDPRNATGAVLEQSVERAEEEQKAKALEAARQSAELAPVLPPVTKLPTKKPRKSRART